MKLLTIVTFVLMACASGLLAAGDRKPTLAEAKAEFEKQDRALNAAWEQVKKALSPGDFAALKEEQRGWVEWRDEMAASPGYSGATGDEAQRKQSAPYFATAAGLTEERAAWLQGLISKTPQDTVTGIWTDSYGGVLEMVEKDGTLYFSINVVRGPSAHLGQLAGVGQWNDVIGWFSDKGRDKSRKDVTNLAFVLDRTKLRIAGANTQHYHGARAYFDGQYVRTGSLDAKAQAAVIKAAQNGGADDR